MRKLILFVIAALLGMHTNAQMQKIRAKDIKDLPDTALIFMAAMWCGGCLEKQKLFEEVHSEQPSLPYYAIYDPRGYTEAKRKRILKHSPDSILVWRTDYFKNDGKVMKTKKELPILTLIAEWEANGFKVVNKNKLWYGHALIKYGNTIYVQSGSKNFRKYVAGVLKKFNITLPPKSQA